MNCITKDFDGESIWRINNDRFYLYYNKGQQAEECLGRSKGGFTTIMLYPSFRLTPGHNHQQIYYCSIIYIMENKYNYSKPDETINDKIIEWILQQRVQEKYSV